MSNLVPVQDIERMATAVAKSNLFGIKTPDQAMALMLIAQAEGMHPAIAARDFHVIQGRPALKADAMLARFQQAGGKVQWETYTDEEVTGVFSHPSGGSVSITWTLHQAHKIGLAGKDNWAKYPRAMLRARVISEGIRTVYPGCVVGTYTPEEVEDFSPAQAAVKDMGKVQEVVEIIEETKQMPFKLFAPGSDEPYAAYETAEEWIDGYGTMVSRVMNSKKIPDDQKQGKLDALGKANVHTIAELSGMLKIKLNAVIVAAGGTLNPKLSESPLPQEAKQEESSDI